MLRSLHGSTRQFALAGAALLCLGLASSAATAQTTQDDKLPSADALLQKMVKAMGGEKTLRKHDHQMLTGTFELPSQGIVADLVIHAAAPNLAVRKIEVPGFGVILSGYNGETAWRDGPPSGPQVLDGKQLAQAIIDSDFHAPLHYRKNFQSIEVVGMTDFAEKNCYDLKLITKDGDEQRLYLDAETHLIAGGVRTVFTGQGDFEAISTIEAYGEFDGEQIATKTRVEVVGIQEQIVTIAEVTFEPFEHDVFDLPDSIKALMEDTPTSQPDN